MKHLAALAFALAAAVGSVAAKPVHTATAYEVDGVKFEGVLIYDDASSAKRPGLVMVPNWMGVNAANLKQATEIAGSDYVVFVADMYGVDIRPTNADEAGKASGPVKGDRAVMRRRVSAALDQLKAAEAPLDAGHLGAIGFCFGGTSALELARSGAEIAGVVSFHGGLRSPTPADAAKIKGRVLALHGADDPYVPAAEVDSFVKEMRAVKGLDWQLVSYGGAVHSFTDVDANVPGEQMYDARTSKRAYQAMKAFFGESW